MEAQNIKEMLNTFVPVVPKDENTNTFVLPVSIGVGAMKLSVKPFKESGIGFNTIVFEGQDITYDGEHIDINRLILSLDTNVTTLKLSGSIQEKTIRIKNLSILDIDTMVFPDIIEKMITIKLHEEIVEQVEPEIEQYKEGKDNWIPKSVLLDTIKVTVKPTSFPQVNIHQGELNASAIALDIYGIIDLKPKSIQVENLSLLVDTNISKFYLDTKLQDETITVNSLSLRKIDVNALTHLFESIKYTQTSKKESQVSLGNKTVNPLLPKFLYVEHMDSSLQNATYNSIFVESAEINVTDAMLNIDTLTVQSGNLDVAVVSSIVSLVLHGALKNNQLKSQGNIITPYTKDVHLENILTLKDGGLDYRGRIDVSLLEANDNNYTQVLNDLKFVYEGNTTGIDVHIASRDIKGKFSSTDFQKGNLTLSTKQPLMIKEIISLPKALKDSRGEATLHVPLDFENLTPINVQASITSNLANIKADLFYDKTLKMITNTTFPQNSLLRELNQTLNLDVLSPLYIDLTMLKEILYIDILSKGLSSKVKFNPENKNLAGNIVLSGEKFTFKGNVAEKVILENSITSLKSLFAQISTIYAFKLPPLDGDAKISVVLKDMKELELKLNSNTLTYGTDTKKKHILNDTMISLSFANAVLTLNKYHTTFEEQKMFATKPSVITFKESNIDISPLWINDEMKVTGRYNTQSQKGEILALANTLTVSHEMADLLSQMKVKTNIQNGIIDIKGTFIIKDGEVHYNLDTLNFASDKDIVVIQDIKENVSTPWMDNLSTSIKVKTLKPLLYRTPEADIQAMVDLTIKKQIDKPFSLQGKVEILQGSVFNLANKRFILKQSFITFTGNKDEMTLNISAKYNTTQAEINILITGSSDAPEVILSSIPYMRKEDITSLLLFDAQTDSDTDSKLGSSILARAQGGMVGSLFSTLGININNLPFMGETNDFNSSKKAIMTFFSSEEAPETDTHKINFTGQQYIQESALQKAMGAETNYAFQFWKKKKSNIKDKHIPTLQESLQDYCRSEGFYDAKFSIKTSNETIWVQIIENTPIRIQDIQINSNYDISHLQNLKEKEIFKAKNFTTLKQDIVQNLLENGYCAYAFESKAYVDTYNHTANIKLDIKKETPAVLVKSPSKTWRQLMKR